MVGAQIRDYELYRRLADRHTLRLVALTETEVPSEHVRHLERVMERVYPVVAPTALTAGLLYHLPRHLRARRPLATLPFVHHKALGTLRAAVRQWRPDVVQIEHSFLAPYVDAIPAEVPTRTVLSLHNVGALQYERMHGTVVGARARATAGLKAWAMRGWEARWAKRFDRVVCVSDADRAHLLDREQHPPVSIVPNGVDTTALRPSPPPGTQALLFAGNLAYGPNADAVRYFCDAIFPRIRQRVPQATFTAAGFAPPPAVQALNRRPGVTIAGSVPDIHPYYERAAACVVPLRAGGGTRLKILEAMALGRPVVSTTVGYEGLDVADGEHLLVADTPSGFAHAATRLLTEPDTARRIARQARLRVEERYGWDAAAARLDALYQDLAPSR